MVLEVVTLCLLILGPDLLGKLYLLSKLGLWLIIISAVASAAEYYIRFGPAILSKDP
jgi:CDP-diacylglycerol--glycerol-3-phosphate 3-phosphatidyltransferase